MVVKDAAKEYRKAQKQAVQDAIATETTESMGDIGKWLRNGGNAPKKRRTGSTGSKGSSMEGVGRTLKRSQRAKESRTAVGWGKKRYEKATKVTHQIISEGSDGRPKIRKVIQDPEELAKIARQRARTTPKKYMLHEHEYKMTMQDIAQASNLKFSLIQFANKYCSPSVKETIKKLDENKLWRLYNSNTAIFEVVFQYYYPPEVMYDGRKDDDFQLLFDLYVETFGPIGTTQMTFEVD